MNLKLKKQKAFTLIELLVTIAIISILTSVIFMAIDSKKQNDRATAIRVIKEFTAIQKALELSSLDPDWGYNSYPGEYDFGLGENPAIVDLIDNGILKYVGREDLVNGQGLGQLVGANGAGVGNGVYRYDNDNDTYNYLNNCPGVNTTAGVNIFIYWVESEEDMAIINELDSILDNGDGLKCGKIRTYDVGARKILDYNISENK